MHRSATYHTSAPCFTKDHRVSPLHCYTITQYTLSHQTLHITWFLSLPQIKQLEKAKIKLLDLGAYKDPELNCMYNHEWSGQPQ